ncbi:hypothetical protein [Methanohalophilus sp. DAL1]|uniref:hypothetical protein n=1 Tax=Methanohalophilus sp. DAL1 TaxID=1864608 RepID=UPI0025BDFD6C|nr:hypothetical protein [Methanohalophilus sp. DAL1]
MFVVGELILTIELQSIKKILLLMIQTVTHGKVWLYCAGVTLPTLAGGGPK